MARFYCVYAFGHLSRSELTDCQSTLISNSHLTVSALQAVRQNVDWSRYLIGRGYFNRPKSSFNIQPLGNRYRDRFSQLVLDPGFSPLSALNDSQLVKLPTLFAVGGSLDPLRDDSKILVARLARLRPLGVSYIEYEGPHVAFIIPSYGLRVGVHAFNAVLKIFQRNAVL